MFTIIGGDGKEYGPVTIDQVRRWLAAGRANLDTKAKAAGTEEWRTLGDFAEFTGPADLPPVLPGASSVEETSSPLASPGARIGAALINAFVYFASTFPGSMLMSRKLLEQYPEMARGGIPQIDTVDLNVLLESSRWVWVGLLAAILLQALLIAVRGQNVGKLIVGARVVRADNGERAGFLRGVLLRFILPVAVFFLLNAFLFLGFIFLLVDFCFIFREDRRCLHDLIAGTKVVRA